MAERFVLTEAERDLLREMIAEYRTRKGGNPGIGAGRYNPNIGSDDWLPPETYVALAPPGGIPAMDEGVTGTAGDEEPGAAVCVIYRLIDGLLVSTGFTRTVHNLSENAVDENSWVIVTRDKYGIWWVTTTVSTNTEVTLDAWFPANVTASSPGVVSFEKLGGTPLTGDASVFPSNEPIPDIPPTQTVLVREDPDYPGTYQATPWGGIQTISFTDTYLTDVSVTAVCNVDNTITITVNKTYVSREVVITGRDLDISIEDPGTGSGS